MTRAMFCEKFESGISCETFQARATGQREQLEAWKDTLSEWALILKAPTQASRM